MENQLSIFENVWIDVIGYEGKYQSNGKGEIKSLNYMKTGKEKILKPKMDNGYLRVTLHNNGNREQPLIHRLVWEAFYGKIPEGMVIGHINTVRDDNRVENLRCVTQKENANNPITKNKMKEVLNNIFNKPVLQFTKDGAFVKEWPSATDAARELGFRIQNISACCLGKRKSAYGSIWKHAS